MSKDFDTSFSDFVNSNSMSELYNYSDDLTNDSPILVHFTNEAASNMHIPSADEISWYGSTQHSAPPPQQYNVNQRPPTSRNNRNRSRNAPVQPPESRGLANGAYASGNFPVQRESFAQLMGSGETGFSPYTATSQSQRPSESMVGGHLDSQQRNEGRRQTGGRRQRERQGRESSFPGDGDVKEFQGFG